MSKFFSIDGYWKDDHSDTFEGYIVSESESDDDENNENDDNIFYYGLSENEIKHSMDTGGNDHLKFVVTAYEQAI